MKEKLDSAPQPKKYAVIGVCGLDYDRLFEDCSQQDQAMIFEGHFDVAQKFNLPMYFTVRSAMDDFVKIVERNLDKFPRGMINSFSGSEEEL